MLRDGLHQMFCGKKKGKLAANLHQTCIKLATKSLMQDELIMWLSARGIQRVSIEWLAGYQKDFGVIRLPVFGSYASRYLIADEAAKRIFFTYLA